MNLESARLQIEKLTNKRITNTMLSEALSMKMPNISRKLNTNSKLKLRQIKQLEDYFSVLLVDDNNSNNFSKIDDDYSALQEIIIIIEQYLSEVNLNLLPIKKAELIILIYKMYLNGDLSDIKKDNVINFCKLAS